MPVTTESPVSSNPYAGMPNNGDVPHDVANAQIDQILAQNNPPAEASATLQSPPAGKYGAVTLPPGYTSDDGKPIVPPGDPATSSGFVSKQADISSPASGFVSSKAQIEATPSGSPAPKALPNSDFVSQKANIGPSGPDSSNFVSQNAPLPAQQAVDAQPDDASTVQTGQVTPGYDANAKLDMSSGGTPQVGKPDPGLDKAIYDTAANVATSGRVDTTMGNQTSVATPEQVKALADSPKNLYQLQAQNQISPETLDSALMLRGQQWNGADPAQKLLRLINTGAQLAGTVMGTATGTVTGELDPLLNVFGRKAPAPMDTTPGGFPKTWEQVSPNQLNKPQGTEDLPQRGPLLQGMEEGSGALFDAAGRSLAKLATSGVDNTTPVTPGGFPKTWEQVGTGPKDPNAPEGPSPTMGINPNVDKAAPPAISTPASEASQANEAALQKDTRTGLSIGSNLLTSVEHAGQAIAQNTGDLADTAAKILGGPSQSINKWLGLDHPEDNLFDAYGFTLRGLPYEQMPLDQRLQYNAARVKQIQDDGTELAGNADNVNHVMDYLTKASGHYTMSPLELKAYGQEVDPTAIQAASLGLQILATHNLPEIPGFGPLVDHLSEGAINGIRAPVRAADLSFKLASAAAKNETALNVIGGLGAINTAWHAIANGNFDLGTMTTLMGTMGGAALGARFAAKSKAVGVFLDHLGAIAAKGDQVMATAADEASAGRPFFGSPTGDIGKWIPPWLRDTGEAIMPSGKMELAGPAGRLAGGIIGQTARAGVSSALMAPAFTQEPEDAAKMVGQMMGYGFMGAVPGAAASAFHAPFDHLFTPKYGSLIPGKYGDAAPFRGFGTNVDGGVNAPFRPYGTDAEADRVDKATIAMFPQDTQNRINNLRQLGSNKWQVHVFDDQSMDNVMQAHTAAQVSRIDQQIAQAQQANSDAIVRGDTPVAQTHADTIQQLQNQKADVLTQPVAGATARGFFFNNGPDGTGPMQAYVRHSSVESALGHEGLGHPVWNIMQAMDAKNGTTYAPDFLNAAKRTTNMDTFANDYVRRISNGGITDATYNNLPPGISQDGIDAELAAEHGAGLLDGAPASLFTKNPSFQRSLTMGVGSALEHVLGIPVTGMLARHEFDGFQGSVGAALQMDQAIRAMSTDPSTIRPWQAKIEKIAKAAQPINPDEAAAQSLAKGGRFTVQQARDIIAKSKQQGSPNGNQPPVKYTPAQNARAILVNPNAQGFTEDEANRHVPDNATNIGEAVMNARKSILAERKAAGIPSPDEQRAAKDTADNAAKTAQDKVDADAQAQANKAEVQNNLSNPEWVSGMEAKHGLKPGSMVAADNGAIHANRLDESPVTLQKGQPIQEGHLGNAPKSDADKVVDDYNRAKQAIEDEFNRISGKPEEEPFVSQKASIKEEPKGPSAPTPEKPPNAPKGVAKPEETKGAQGGFGEPYVSPGPGTEITSKGVTEHQPRKKKAIPPVNQNLPSAPGPVPGAPVPVPLVTSAPGILTPITPTASAPEAAPKETNEHTVEHQKALVEEGHSPGRAQKIVNGETPKIAPSLGPGHHNIGAYGYAGDASWDHGSLRGVGAFGHVSKPGSLIEGYSAGLTKEGAARRGLTHHGQEFYGEDGNLYRWDDTAPTDFEFHGQHHHVNDDYIDVYSPHHAPDHGVSAEQIASNEAYMAKFPVGQNGKRGPINPGDTPAPALNDAEGGSGVTGESKQPSSDIKPPTSAAVPSPLPAPIDVSKPSEPLKNVESKPFEDTQEAPRQTITPQTIEDAQVAARQQVTSRPGTQAYDNAVQQNMLMNLGAQHAASLAPGDTRVTYDPASSYISGTHFVMDGSDSFHNWLLKGQSPDVINTLSKVQDAISEKKELSINYGSAIQKESGTPTGAQREASQAKDSATSRAQGLSDIQSAGKSILPSWVGITPGKNGKTGTVIYGGVSAPKIASNASTITHALGPRSPYPTAPLGDNGVAEMDMRGYLSNISNGWKGDGSAKLSPIKGNEADIPQESPGFEPYNLSPKKSSFWSLSVNGSDAKMSQNAKRAPAAAKAFELSKKNSGFTSGSYTNKLAQELDIAHPPEPVLTSDPNNPDGPKIQKIDSQGNGLTQTWTQHHLHSGYEMLHADLTDVLGPNDKMDPAIHPAHSAVVKGLVEKGQPPSCYSSDTEILSRRGWLLFNNLLPTDEVATRNPDTKSFEWQLPSGYINESYSGDMIHFHSRSLDVLVTPNHRMLVTRPSTGSEWVLTAKELSDKHSGDSNVCIPMTSYWIGTPVASQSFNGTPTVRSRQCNNSSGFAGVYWSTKDKRYIASIKIDGKSIYIGSYVDVLDANEARKAAEIQYVDVFKSCHAASLSTVITGDDFCSLMGAYVAEGCCFTRGIWISQRPESKGFKTYKELMERIQGFSGFDGSSGFRISRKALVPFFKQFGLAKDKFVPDEIMNASERQIRLFLTHYILGDGYFKGVDPHTLVKPPYQKGSQRFIHGCTTSQRLADQLEELWQKIGYSSGVAVARVGGSRYFKGKWNKSYVCNREYTVNVRFSNQSSFNSTTLEYNGSIHCVQVPNGIVYVRRNGKPAWSGNSIVKAGFMPGEEKERTVRSALKTPDGQIMYATNHPEMWMKYSEEHPETQDWSKFEEGYLTNKRPFVSKDEWHSMPRSSRALKASFMPSEFNPSNPEDFIKARDKTTRAGYLSPLAPEDIKDHRLYVNKEGTVGAAVDPKGDVQNVFNNGGPKGAGADAVAHAISQGGNTLDAFDNYLPKLYRQFGFQETGRMKFNPDYAPHGWDYAKDDNPDVVFMAHKGYPTGGPEAAIERAKGDKSNWIKNERSDKYEDDYDTAKQSSRRAVQRGGTEVSGVHGETRGTPSNLPGEASLSETGEGHRGFANGDDQGEAYQTSQGGRGIAEADAERLGAYSQALQEHRDSSDRIDKAFRQGGKPHAIDVAEEESAKQIPALRELAKSRGELLPPMDRASDAHGSEHQVWFSDDGKTATKETYYINDPAHGDRKRFGAVPTLDASDVRDATPHEYLDRIGISNEMGRKTRVVGVVDQGNGETRIRTEEPTISDAVGHPSMDDISDYMAKRGFQPKEWTSWYNPETKVLASDAQPRNFLKTDHGIYPVDTMLRHADSIATPLTDADRLKKNEQQRSHLEKQQAKLDTTKPEEDMAWEIMASKIHDLEREHQRLTESVKSGSDRDLTSEPSTERGEAYGNKAQFMPMGGEKAESYEKAKKKGYVFTGPDKQHRFEIDDSKSRFIKPVSDSPWDSTPLKNVLKHPSLYKEYPQLAEIPVSVGTDPGDAAYFQSATHPTADFMGVLHLSPDADKADVIHEVQHIIQRIEGRPSYGSSPDIEANAITPSEYKMLRSASGKDFDEIEPPLSKDQWEQGGSPNGTFSKYLSNLKNRKNRYIEAAVDHVVPTARYWSNSGEVEAREAARRSDMTPEQRLSSPPDLENSGPLPDALNPAINAPERYQPMMKKAAQYMPGELSPKTRGPSPGMSPEESASKPGSAAFMPGDRVEGPNGERERIKSPAVRYPSGGIYEGVNHPDAFDEGQKQGEMWPSKEPEKGYMTKPTSEHPDGRFVGDKEGWKIGKRSSQLHPDVDPNKGFLNSEDLADYPHPEDREPKKAQFMPMGGPKGKGFKDAEREGRTFLNPYDKLPRYEISDHDMRWKFPPISEMQPRQNYSLGDFISHPTLFKDYPDLKDVNVRYDPNMKGASFTPRGKYADPEHTAPGVIKLSDPNSKSDLIHEIQHAIQSQEDFPYKGSSPEREHTSMGYDEFQSVKSKALKDFDNRFLDPDGEHLAPHLKGLYPNQSLDQIKDNYVQQRVLQAAHEKYESNPGEIEAREAASRRSLSPEERAGHPPFNPEDSSYIEPNKAHFMPPDNAVPVEYRKNAKGEETSVKIPFDITHSPLISEKQPEDVNSKSPDTLPKDQYGYLSDAARRKLSAYDKISATGTFASKIARVAKQALKDPEVAAGIGWYSRMRDLLSKAFGENHEMFSHLLGVTSPMENPVSNFLYALEAYDRWQKGDFDKNIDLYKKGYEMRKLGTLIDHVSDELNLKVPTNKQGEVTDAGAMAAYIRHHGLEPLRENGLQYGFHGMGILQALSKTWMEESHAPKTRNYSGNLLGTTTQATIDTWMARLMRQIGYEGHADQWRLQPENEGNISDMDFGFSQLAFDKAAAKLKVDGKPMNADDLQALLWFHIKGEWENNGWMKPGTAGAEKSSLDVPFHAAFPQGPTGPRLPHGQVRKAMKDLLEERKTTPKEEEPDWSVPSVPRKPKGKLPSMAA